MRTITHVTSRTLRLLQLIKEALKGDEKVYTTGSINRALILLAIPMMLEMTMESLFALVDAFFVGRLGKAAISTVGLTESVLSLIYAIAVGISMAATAIVARRIGEKDPEGASKAAVQALYLSLGFSVIVSICGIIFAKEILGLMGADAEMIRSGHRYTQIAMGSNLVIVLLFLINGIFRGAGEASIAMRSLWLANILNIILCPLFIYGFGPVPAFGLEGAAIATTIGRGTGVAYQLFHLFGGKRMIHVTWRHINPEWSTILKMIKLASGGTLQFLIGSASWIFLIRIISQFGEDALAGYTFAIRIIIFAILPAWGVANAAATLVGQNLGAGEPERAEKSVWKAAYLNMIILGFVSVVFIIFAPWILRFFSQDPAVLAYGIEGLRLISLGYIFYAFGMVMAQSFNGAGDTKTPTIINLIGFWVIQIPLAYFLAITLKWGPTGVFWAIFIAESVIALTAVIVFRKGNWKKIKV
ncbi:MATE family efflux transporter [Chitinophaga sp. SYP-B3965]|uniref:MATE family efflux transporter n=1 Tax=Chitinophaga sp. SYP-B3965 TaxID=2663120 RepID=UPI0012999127|nr:MATE family efflux transporter [Chitinophaga sp. SYP-B3965]MRG46734.1 MATE family efflux transporter [Chitinophaga sp. SYP-B3965]